MFMGCENNPHQYYNQLYTIEHTAWKCDCEVDDIYDIIHDSHPSEIVHYYHFCDIEGGTRILFSPSVIPVIRKQLSKPKVIDKRIQRINERLDDLEEEKSNESNQINH